MKKMKCPDFGKKHLIQNIYLFIPLALLLLLAWANFEEQNTVFGVSTATFIFGVIGGLIWNRIRLKKFYCPQCNRLIEKPTITERKEGDPINYKCNVCNIEWETGLREGGMD
jgi:predicted RNA-binding Zn-ribbon protein involved in translation (DUF1610 family)